MRTFGRAIPPKPRHAFYSTGSVIMSNFMAAWLHECPLPKILPLENSFIDRVLRSTPVSLPVCCIIMPSPLIGESIKRWCCLTSNVLSVCLTSVYLFIAYIGHRSRTERPRKTKIGTEVAHVTRDSEPFSRSKVKCTRPLWLLIMAGQHGHTVMVIYP